METHVRILGWLIVFFGVLGLLGALAILAGSAAVSSVIGLGGDEALLPMHIVALIGGALTIFTLLISLPALLAGYGLLNFRPWARIVGLVFGAFALLHVPFGTALGIYTFWVLLQPGTEALFRRV
ncbi:MAG: hypothetical protein ACLQBJ_18490 [Bryobacteraceae bacterium]